MSIQKNRTCQSLAEILPGEPPPVQKLIIYCRLRWAQVLAIFSPGLTAVDPVICSSRSAAVGSLRLTSAGSFASILVVINRASSIAASSLTAMRRVVLPG